MLPWFLQKVRRALSRASTNQICRADEGALYDRQIRLWGLEAQEKWATPGLIEQDTSDKCPECATLQY